MSTSFISSKTRFYAAENFKNSFSSLNNPVVGYLYIANHIPYANDSIVEDVSQSEVNDRKIWDNLIAGKKLIGGELELVIPRKPWISNTIYYQYDDAIEANILLTGNTSLNISSMYVINSNNQVYKCINNNTNQPSMIEPTGQALTSDGNLLTSDSYIWKYLYEVPESSPFSSNTWIPVPTSATKLQYSANTSTAVDGELITVVVTDSGSEYYNNSIEVLPFGAACTRLTLRTVDDLPKVSYKMGVSGTGIFGYTHITSIDEFNRYIDLSYPTYTAGGGPENTLYVFTRSEITGDGTGAVANTILANTGISAIKLTTYGKDYSYANVTVYGTGSGAVSRAILPPKYGHGYNAAKELGAYNVMVNVDFGEIDSSESGIISIDTTFRQCGILCNPCLYGTSEVASNANSVISQTTNITVDEGIAFQKNELVYQGTLTNPTFSGIVQEEDANNIVYLTNAKGEFASPTVLKGANTNPSGRLTRDIVYPTFEPYSGDVLYAQNILPIQRTNDQFENIKVIIKF